MPVRVVTPTRWPIERCSSSASLRLTSTSPRCPGSRPETWRSGSKGSRIAETTIAGANFGSTALPPTTSEPVWKSSPWTSAAPATCAARTTVRWSIRSLAPKVLVKALRGDIWASTPELAVRVMSFIAVRI